MLRITSTPTKFLIRKAVDRDLEIFKAQLSLIAHLEATCKGFIISIDEVSNVKASLPLAMP